MNTDQIFEEIQNDYLCIQEEYQELDNLTNKYNNLNYAFEEISVQLEAINKFGLSDEISYFINKDNYLVENNYIAEEDLYDKNKVIITLEGILSTIISGIDKIIKTIAKILGNIFKFIFNIIKKMFRISDNTDKEIDQLVKKVNKIKEKEDKEKAQKELDDFLNRFANKNISISNILYKYIVKDNNDICYIIDYSFDTIDDIKKDIIKIIDIFDDYIIDLNNCMLKINNDKYLSYIDFNEDTFNEPYNIYEKWEISRDRQFKKISKDCNTLFLNNKSKSNHVYCTNKIDTVTNNLNKLKPFRFVNCKINNDFYKKINDIVKFENTIDLSKGTLFIKNGSDINRVSNTIIDFYRALQNRNHKIKHAISVMNDTYKNTSKKLQIILSAFECLSKKITKTINHDDLTEKYIKKCKHYQSFISNLLLSIKSDDVFVLKELGFNVCLNLLYSYQRSLDNIVRVKKGK